MRQTFYKCSNLTTIYVSEYNEQTKKGWSIESVTMNGSMFGSCSNLKGGQGTVFDSSHDEKDYARIDGGPSNPGYLTDIKDMI